MCGVSKHYFCSGHFRQYRFMLYVGSVLLELSWEIKVPPVLSLNWLHVNGVSMGLIYKTYLRTDLILEYSCDQIHVLDVENDISLRLVLVRVSTFPCGNTGVLQEFRTLRAPTRSFI